MTGDDKHLQLGVDLAKDDRSEISDEEKDALWDSARTVEEFEEGLVALQALDPDVVESLRAIEESLD